MYANLGACCVCCLLPAQQLRAVVADDRMQLFDMHKPVIACIHGNCLAGGNDVAGLCDLIVCAEDATFAFPPARDLGCLPNQMWFYHLGPQWTKRLALTGDSVDGKTAAEIGLALKCVPAEDLEEEVEGIADRMCLIDPECVPHFRSRLVDCMVDWASCASQAAGSEQAPGQHGDGADGCADK